MSSVVVLKDITDIVEEWCLDQELEEMSRDYEYQQWLDSVCQQQEEDMFHVSIAVQTRM